MASRARACTLLWRVEGSAAALFDQHTERPHQVEPADLVGHLVSLGEFRIPGLSGPRRVRVWLPETPPPYPVAYLWDGQNLFSDSESGPGGSWRVHEVIAARSRAGRRSPMVVAIDHGGVFRVEDLTPWQHPKMGGGQADALLRFVVERLKPQIDERFPTEPGMEDTLVGGSSLGGLMSLYAFAKHPDVFGRVMAMSPSIWFAPFEVFRMMNEVPIRPEHRIYLDMGRHEGTRVNELLERLERELVEARKLDDSQLLVHYDAKGRHSETSWRRRLPAALDFLLAG